MFIVKAILDSDDGALVPVREGEQGGGTPRRPYNPVKPVITKSLKFNANLYFSP